MQSEVGFTSKYLNYMVCDQFQVIDVIDKLIRLTILRGLDVWEQIPHLRPILLQPNAMRVEWFIFIW